MLVNIGLVSLEMNSPSQAILRMRSEWILEGEEEDRDCVKRNLAAVRSRCWKAETAVRRDQRRRRRENKKYDN